DISPFFINIKTKGIFKINRFRKILWLGLEQGNEEVVNLYKAIIKENQEENFIPHITIARSKSRRDIDIADVDIKTKVDRIHFVQSILSDKKPEYIVKREMFLGQDGSLK
ncbi:2'-5' RNA ligase family protein, partial [bacterium]